MLFEKACNLLPIEDMSIRIKELLSRLNSNEINFQPKIKTLLMLTKLFNATTLDPIGTIDFIQCLREVRSVMIQPALA
jgi:hypothetical protein